MVSTTSILCAFAVAAIATSSTGVDAHGTLAKPGLKFTGSGYGGNFAALVPQTVLKPQPGDNFKNYPSAAKNAAAFDRSFKAAGYKTLKDFLLKHQDMSKGRTNMPKTPACGFTDPTGGAVQPLPAQLEWYGGQMNHDGPCEVWCDNEIVLPFTANCAQTYPQGKFNYNRAKCVGKSRLTMYWMSTLMEWQVYIQCAKIGNGQRSMDDDDSEEALPLAKVEESAFYNATAFEGQDEAEHELENAEAAAYADVNADSDDDERAADSDDEFAEVTPSPDYVLPDGPTDAQLEAETEAQDAQDAARGNEVTAGEDDEY